MIEVASEYKSQPKSLFISHGAPDLISSDLPAKHFLQDLGVSLHWPKAILIISAHWNANQLSLLGKCSSEIEYDFYGFHHSAYKEKYRATYDASMIDFIVEKFDSLNESVVIDHYRKMDHGAWAPLSLMFPEKNIPVIQISLIAGKGFKFHYELGQSISGLYNEGILVVGSGGSTHNLQLMCPEGTPPLPQLVEFEAWLYSSLKTSNIKSLLNLFDEAPFAKLAHPSAEHIMPLFFVLGAMGESFNTQRLHHSYTYGNIGMSSFSFY